MARSSVLVVDHARDRADGLVLFLGENGFQARAAYEAQAAIRLARSWRPASAVLDLSVPGVSGLKVARSLRETFGRDIRLVACAAWAERELYAATLAPTFDHVLLKPCETRDLLLLLSPDVRDTVLRSMDVNATQLRLQIELADSLLRHAQLMTDQATRERMREFIGRRLDLLDATLRRGGILGTEQGELERRLALVRERLQQIA